MRNVSPYAGGVEEEPVGSPLAIARSRHGCALLIFLLSLVCGAATAVAVPTVVVVKSSEAEPYNRAEAACRSRLAEQHYAIRSVLLKDAPEKDIVAGFGPADAVVAIGTPAARAIHLQLPSKVKLLYCMVNDPGQSGLLQGTDCWGVTTEVALVEQMKLIGETLPQARKVGTLYRSDSPEGIAVLQSLREAIPHDWRLETVAVNEFPSVAAAIAALVQKNVDIVWTTADQKLYDNASVRALLLACLRVKIPVWGFSPAFVRAGAVVGVGVEAAAQGAQVADLLIKLLKDPESIKIKVHPPREFQIAVNLIVAKELNLAIPESVPQRAAFIYRTEK